ncbi:hypothetical protein ACEPAI_2190 [Sanghuangporus weigelae]
MVPWLGIRGSCMGPLPERDLTARRKAGMSR